MRNVLIVILVMIQGASNAQFVKSEFRTVMEDGFMLHYLKFLRQGTAQVKFSINHGQAMAGLQAKTYELNYTVKGDTLDLLRSNNLIPSTLSLRLYLMEVSSLN